MKPLPFALTALLLLSACAQPAYIDIQAAQPVPVGDGISVTPQIEWGKANMTGFNGTLWTVDGVNLDALFFFTARPGHPLIEFPDTKTKEHLYQASMLPDDIMELAAASFRGLGFEQLATRNLRPAPFGSAKGFRFDLTYITHAGLEMKGMAFGCQRNGGLDLIVFTAPAEYYFGHYAPAVENIFASVQASG